MGKVIYLNNYRPILHAAAAYKDKLDGMNKLEVFEEMVAYQEEFKLKGQSYEGLERGVLIFTKLEEIADTDDLRIMAKNHREHLQHLKLAL